MPSGGQILAADIGGTHARFLFDRDFRPSSVPPPPTIDLSSREAGSIEALLVTALEKLGIYDCGNLDAVLAVAAPVHGNRISLTNLSWEADAARLKRQFGFRRLAFINDLEAAALALAERPPADAALLRGGDAGGRRTALVSVGTGLGVAYWSGSGGGLQVESSEAGHLAFAPAEPWQTEYLRALQLRYGERVSWERTLSGEGLAQLDAFLRRGKPATPAEVAHRAASGDTLALTALQHFARLLGAFAGDLVLAAPAWGGVWLVGGVLAGLGPLFDTRLFLEAFDAKGRLAPVMANVPVRWTDDGGLGVHGAWLAARAAHHAYRRDLWASA